MVKNKRRVDSSPAQKHDASTAVKANTINLDATSSYLAYGRMLQRQQALGGMHLCLLSSRRAVFNPSDKRGSVSGERGEITFFICSFHHQTALLRREDGQKFEKKKKNRFWISKIDTRTYQYIIIPVSYLYRRLLTKSLMLWYMQLTYMPVHDSSLVCVVALLQEVHYEVLLRTTCSPKSHNITWSYLVAFE